jgi:hypothetical protein
VSPQEYCTGWRQVRVFITDPLPGAFHSFHCSNTIPRTYWLADSIHLSL